MRYLFFDIECCNGEHICEFGYVICDEEFNISERDVITVNPERRFHLSGRKGSDDIVLFFDEDTYFNSPTFPAYYDKIKMLLEAKDQIIIGHAVANDAVFIRTACMRYNLEPINFKFADSQRIYSEFANDSHPISLENAEAVLELQKPEYLHKSDEDAILTMRLVESICKKMNASLFDVLITFPCVCGKSESFEITYFGEGLAEILEAIDKNPHLLTNAKKQKAIKQFYKNAEPTGDIISCDLNNKSICFSSDFEKNEPRGTIILIQMLIDRGAKYITKVSDDDYYVATSEELENEAPDAHSRYYSALCMKKSGKGIKIISFFELCKMLDISIEHISQLPMPAAPKRNPSNIKARSYSRGNDAISTLGENLKAKGIDLLKVYS